MQAVTDLGFLVVALAVSSIPYLVYPQLCVWRKKQYKSIDAVKSSAKTNAVVVFLIVKALNLVVQQIPMFYPAGSVRVDFFVQALVDIFRILLFGWLGYKIMMRGYYLYQKVDNDDHNMKLFDK